MWKKKIFCVYGCFNVSLYVKGGKKSQLETIEFLETHVVSSNSHWQSSGILIFWRKCCIVISDTLLSSFLDVLFLLFAVILSGLHEEPRKNKDWVTEKKYIEEFVWGTSLSWQHTLLSMSVFVAFFIYSLPLLKWCIC